VAETIVEGGTRFWGTHAHTIDSKGRVILPAKFRDAFRDGAFLTKLPEGCLGVWTQPEFDKQTAAVLERARQGQANRNVARVWSAGVSDGAPDAQGRVAVPPHLRTYAQLDGDVVITGVINHLEIWNARKWDEINAEGSQFLISGTDALDDFGF
jgi:MraZ protein